IMAVSIFAILANTLRIRGVDLKRDDRGEIGPLNELELLVPSMVCEGCAEKISSALRAVPGVREVKPKVPQKHVYVQYDPQRVKNQALKDAVSKAGFAAVEA
ncbi:MAG: heavy-metal-associated domain-containing protein, partial [Gammaproteobacteria bacterium]